MAIWKDIVTKEPEPNEAPPVVPAINRPRPEVVPTAVPPGAAVAARKDLKESVLAAGLTFEGKNEGSGHVPEIWTQHVAGQKCKSKHTWWIQF